MFGKKASKTHFFFGKHLFDFTTFIISFEGYTLGPAIFHSFHPGCKISFAKLDKLVMSHHDLTEISFHRVNLSIAGTR